jgi:addiction module HigA family antidote
MLRIPTNRRPVHAGEILREEFLEPMGLSQVELADRLGIPFQRVNMIVREKRAVTPDTALRLSRLFGTTVDFWMNLQLACDVYDAEHSPEAKSIQKIERLKMAERSFKAAS